MKYSKHSSFNKFIKVLKLPILRINIREFNSLNSELLYYYQQQKLNIKDTVNSDNQIGNIKWTFSVENLNISYDNDKKYFVYSYIPEYIPFKCYSNFNLAKLLADIKYKISTSYKQYLNEIDITIDDRLFDTIKPLLEKEFSELNSENNN